MSITTYEFLSVLQAQDNAESNSGKNNFDYMTVLDRVRSTIAQSHATELAAALDDEKAAQTLKHLILKYAAECMAGKDYDREALVVRIYQDMAGLGILTKYLYDPSVEEINLNGYNAVEIIRAERTDYLYGTEAFPSPNAALDIVKRMVRMGGMLLDAQTPRVDSYIGSGTRISAIIPPLVPPEQGVIVSIRKQNKNHITREQLIDSGSATADMLDFLSMCLCYGVSIGAAGATSSGKSTLMAYLLNDYIQKNNDYNNRIYIIEDSRELNLMDYDNANDRPARVLFTVTKAAYYSLTVACAGAGFFAGRVVYHSLLISIAVSIMGLFAPLLLFGLRQTKAQSARLDRLASSMMILSNSYLVTEDFITTVSDNVDGLEYPEPFRDFLAYVTLMDSDINNGLRRMEDQVNNGYFSQWIDALILAQDDRALKYVAVSVVESMHDVLQVQQESDAAMYAVWRDYLLTLILIFSVPLVFKILMADSYVTLTTSPIGQGLFVLLLVAVMYSVFRALKINRPLMI